MIDRMRDGRVAAVDALLIGRSAVMRALRTLIVQVAPATLPVLIQGPSGAGKELVAQALHVASGRTGRFVPFNVCAIPDTMLEDDLFGHVKGAFTGATRTQAGYLREADGGTAFFDEISGLGMSAQVKLLRAIDSQVFRPIGGQRDERSSFRVVSATNEDLESLAVAGRFRMDLASRLRGVVISVPQLAEHLEDVPDLVAHFLALQLGRENGKRTEFTDGAIRLLQEYPWPGNVRELRHMVYRTCALSGGEVITARNVAENLEQPRATVHADDYGPPRNGAAQLAKDLLVALDESRGDVAAVAEHFRTTPGTVYRWMRTCGIPTPKRRRVRPLDSGNTAGSTTSLAFQQLPMQMDDGSRTLPFRR